ncbi:hypothetical protein [Candidatus Poriferisodalis sp.]|uniref:hypothetical protein n=1 Tax=Candidatus Poriferisodalis sp. TaxID=3101277 RepID=UPI003B598ABD
MIQDGSNCVGWSTATTTADPDQRRRLRRHAPMGMWGHTWHLRLAAWAADVADHAEEHEGF